MDNKVELLRLRIEVEKKWEEYTDAENAAFEEGSGPRDDKFFKEIGVKYKAWQAVANDYHSFLTSLRK